jgi:hypothetical protein
MKFKKEQLVQKLKQLELLCQIKGNKRVTSVDVDNLNSIDNFINSQEKELQQKADEEMLIKQSQRVKDLRQKEDFYY